MKNPFKDFREHLSQILEYGHITGEHLNTQEIIAAENEQPQAQSQNTALLHRNQTTHQNPFPPDPKH